MTNQGQIPDFPKGGVQTRDTKSGGGGGWGGGGGAVRFRPDTKSGGGGGLLSGSGAGCSTLVLSNKTHVEV